MDDSLIKICTLVVVLIGTFCFVKFIIKLAEKSKKRREELRFEAERRQEQQRLEEEKRKMQIQLEEKHRQEMLQIEEERRQEQLRLEEEKRQRQLQIKEERKKKREEKNKKLALRKELIQKINSLEPEYTLWPVPRLEESYKNFDKKKITKKYIEEIEKKNASIKKRQYALYLKERYDYQKQLIELNNQLKLDSQSDVGEILAFDESHLNLREYTVSLNSGESKKFIDFFKEQTWWKNFEKNFFEDYNHLLPKPYDEFFSVFSDTVIEISRNRFIIFLPCYIVDLNVNTNNFNILSYSKVMPINEIYTVDTEQPKKKDKIVSQKYQHQNSNGQPDKRYIHNPLLYSIERYRSVLRFPGKKLIYEFATLKKMENAMTPYLNLVEELSKEPIKTILAKSSKAEEWIDIDRAQEEFAENIRLEEQKLEKKQKRLEEQQKKELLRIEKEKQKQRKLLVEKQKELTREENERKFAQEKALHLFETDIVSEATDVHQNNSYITDFCFFEIIDQKSITNSLFKLSLQPAKDYSNAEEYTLYYADGDANIISQRRKIEKNINGTITVGMALLSNIDFTQMKTCYLIIENGEGNSERIPHKINISFYSDF